ncbi:hypothetical protein ISN45_At03g036470 [Arabidopsis thaliana x Arabidopsis arenosa]|uniref:Transmembrane protein n=2 Tax=Arabidopsis TaxID=3701 RepID=A0A178VFT0_ARATH|nr:hypothetical protein ISN45_At03g036470 [Arabidopsis thaliana x Arabidopsis arenosa]OAP04604.1 hypothetical protein AXX17_AT3G37800 [Arabidopsis thaliana]
MDYQTLEIEDPNDVNIPDAENCFVEPGWAALFSLLAIYAILFSIDNFFSCKANFSIQSISVSSSSTESVWIVYFIGKKPSFMCSISYEREYVSANLSPLKSAIVNVSHCQRSNASRIFPWFSRLRLRILDQAMEATLFQVSTILILHFSRSINKLPRTTNQDISMFRVEILP